MTKLKFLPSLIFLLLAAGMSYQATAQGTNGLRFYVSSAACLPLTGGLQWKSGLWEATLDGARLLCPVTFGKDEDWTFQTEINHHGSDSSTSSQKISCGKSAWLGWSANDIAGSISCTLGKGDTLAGLSVQSGGNTPAHRANFLITPVASCYVVSGSYTTSSNYGSITASGSGSVSVKCPMIQANVSQQTTARFHFGKNGTATCYVYSLGLYGQERQGDYSSAKGTKSTNSSTLDIKIPEKRDYLFARCSFSGTSFSGISY